MFKGVHHSVVCNERKLEATWVSNTGGWGWINKTTHAQLGMLRSNLIFSQQHGSNLKTI